MGFSQCFSLVFGMLTHAPTWMRLEHVVLSDCVAEDHVWEKHTRPLICQVWDRQLQRDRKGSSGCQGPGWREGGWGVTANGNGVSFCGDGMAFGPQTGNPMKATMTPCLTQ